MQAFFFFTQRLLGIFNIGDIDGGADVAQKVAGVGETRHAEGIHPAVFTVMAAQTKVGFERNALVHRACVIVDKRFMIFGMDVTRPDFALQLGFAAGADKLSEGFVDGLTAVNALEPDDYRRAFSKQAETRFAFADRFGALFDIVDIDQKHHRAFNLAIGGAVGMDPQAMPAPVGIAHFALAHLHLMDDFTDQIIEVGDVDSWSLNR